MMKTLDEIKNVLREDKKYLKETYGVLDLQIFGSYARGEQTEDSDVDLLVTFSRPLGGFAFIDLADELEQILGMKVDLLTLPMITHNKYLYGEIKKDLQHV